MTQRERLIYNHQTQKVNNLQNNLEIEQVLRNSKTQLEDQRKQLIEQEIKMKILAHQQKKDQESRKSYKRRSSKAIRLSCNSQNVSRTSQFNPLNKQLEQIRASESDFSENSQYQNVLCDGIKSYQAIEPMKIIISNQNADERKRESVRNNQQLPSNFIQKLEASQGGTVGGEILLDSFMLKSSEMNNNYTQYSGIGSYFITSQNQSIADTRQGNYNPCASQMDRTFQDENPIIISDSEEDGSISGPDVEHQDSLPKRGNSQRIEVLQINENNYGISPSNNADRKQISGNLTTKNVDYHYNFKYSSASNQNKYQLSNMNGSSASVLYNYLKGGSSSDHINKTFASGQVSRKASSQLRVVKFKNSNTLISRGSTSKEVDKYLQRLNNYEDDEYWKNKPTILEPQKYRLSITDMKFDF
ncbi:UNKNOWN [Stylonychia lemnae]|uniref:Uncharacterized protein n=1 Tax=Stylonychia lemnae TaxID=5949 RepID=A0A078A755_STYLE|nr:UNKNOWN [Stylonychia lemnae]|eukprot:CDW77716.1 UNKNOWN [Stylonychia lemnae]